MNRNFFFVVILLIAGTAWAGMELSSARIYKKQGDYAKALEFYDEALTKEPGVPEALFERGELLGIIAMDDAYVAIRKKVAGDAPNPRREVLARMIADFDAVKAVGDEKKTKKLLKKIGEITQEYWWTYYSQAVSADSIYRAENEGGDSAKVVSSVNGGLQSAETAILLDPNHWSSRFVYAQLKGYQTKDEAYVAAWDAALETIENSALKTEDPESFKNNREFGWLQLVQYYYAKEDHQNTLKIADRMLQEDPGSVEAVQYKAFTLATMANNDSLSAEERDAIKRDALDALAVAKQSNPDDENILYYIGQFNLQLKDTASALTAFDEYLTKAPDDRDVLFIEGLIYLEGEKFGDLKKAVEKFGTVKDKDDQDGAAWINYGIALIRMGKNEEGAAAVKKGEELSGN